MSVSQYATLLICILIMIVCGIGLFGPLFIKDPLSAEIDMVKLDKEAEAAEAAERRDGE